MLVLRPRDPTVAPAVALILKKAMVVSYRERLGSAAEMKKLLKEVSGASIPISESTALPMKGRAQEPPPVGSFFS
jgi:hypothetical protein